MENAEKEKDETEYLIKSEANRKCLLEAIENVEKGRNLVVLDLDNLEKKSQI